MGAEIKTEISFEDLVLENDQAIQGEEGNFTFEEAISQEEEIITPPAGALEEEEVEEVIEETPEEKAAKAQQQAAPELTSFSNAAKKLLEKGDWVDVLIGEEGSEVKLSEMDDLDEDTFLGIWEEQKKLHQEEQKGSSISTKNVDENTKKILNIIANGGDLTSIFQSESDMKRPYEGMDLENQQNLQNIVFQQYLRQGISQEDARELVIKATKDLTLDKKAEKIVEHYQNQFDENLKKLDREVAEAKIAEQNNIKEYRKNLATVYKEEGLEENLYKNFVDAATKTDKDGNLHIDTVFEKLMKDPEQAKDLIFFMLEKEKFLVKKGASIKRDVTIGSMRKIKLVQETAKTNVAPKEEEEIGTSKFDIELE